MSVSLSDIRSFRPDAELAKGTPAGVIDISSGLQAVTNAAQQRSQNILARYSMFQKQLSDYTRDHEVDFTGVLKEDIPQLKDKAVKFFDKVRKDPTTITNLGEDSDWVDLQSSIAKSRSDNGYLTLQNQFRNQHPDLYNPENNDVEKQFRSTPLEARQTFSWNLPATLDIGKLAETALQRVGQGFDESRLYSQPGYFLEIKGKNYPKQTFDENGKINGGFDYVWDNLLKSGLPTDNYGHTVEQAAQSTFNNLDNATKSYYLNNAKGNPEEALRQYWKDAGTAYYRAQDIGDTQLTEDKYANEQQKLDLNKQRLALDNDKLGLEWAKLNKVDLPKAHAQIDFWKSKTTGGDAQKNAALSKANRIYSHLQSLATNGVIPPKNVTKLTSEDLKYLGINLPAQMNEIGKVTKAAGLQPLEITDKDAIDLVGNGEIRVLENAHKLSNSVNWGGKYNKKKNTNIQNVATNIINEELKNAGSNELNAYIGADILGSGDTEENAQVVSQTPNKTVESTTVKFNTTGLTQINKNGKNYYVDPKTRKVFDESGKELK